MRIIKSVSLSKCIINETNRRMCADNISAACWSRAHEISRGRSLGDVARAVEYERDGTGKLSAVTFSVARSFS